MWNSWNSTTTNQYLNPSRFKGEPTPTLSSSLLIDIHDSDFLLPQPHNHLDIEHGFEPSSFASGLNQPSSSSSTPEPPHALPTWSFHTDFHPDDYEDLSVLHFSLWNFVLEFLSKAQALVFDILEVRGTFTGRTRLRPEGRSQWNGNGGGGGRFDYGRYLDGWKVGWGEAI